MLGPLVDSQCSYQQTLIEITSSSMLMSVILFVQSALVLSL